MSDKSAFYSIHILRMLLPGSTWTRSPYHAHLDSILQLNIDLSFDIISLFACDYDLIMFIIHVCSWLLNAVLPCLSIASTFYLHLLPSLLPFTSNPKCFTSDLFLLYHTVIPSTAIFLSYQRMTNHIFDHLYLHLMFYQFVSDRTYVLEARSGHFLTKLSFCPHLKIFILRMKTFTIKTQFSFLYL